MLNFKNKGIPIARVTGTKNKKNILFLDVDAVKKQTVEKATNNNTISSFERPTCPYCNKSYYSPWELRKHVAKSCKVKQMKDYAALVMNKEKDEKEEKEIISKEKTIREINGKEIILPEDQQFIPIPNMERRELLYITGCQGSGKTSYATMYLKEFNRMFKKRPTFLFSRIDEDKSLEGIKNLKQIKLDDDLLEEPLHLDELRGSCCLFDDIENSQNKTMQKYLEDLRDEVLQNGRDHTDNKKNEIYIICTNHLSSDFIKTRKIINECTSITLFPSSGSFYSINRILKVYCGLSKKEIDRILSLPSRWVTIYRHFPPYILYERGCYLLSK